MKGYWKIPKEWMHGWGLTATECIVLADLTSWQGADGQGVTIEERAKRCRMKVRALNNTLNRLLESEQASAYIVGQGLRLQRGNNRTTRVQKLHNKECKNCTITVQNMHNNCAKIAQSTVQKLHNPPHPLYSIEENIEEKSNSESEARAHTREGNVRERVEAAPDPSVVAPLDQVYREHRAELSGDTELAQTAIRLFGIDRDRLLQAADIFRDHLAADGIAYKSRGDYRRHFNAWLKLNAKRIFNENGNRINNHLSITPDLLREFTS